jgi:hypothetical protein
MAKLTKALAWLTIVLLAVGVVAGPRAAAASLIAFIGVFVALRNGYFRGIAAEQFTLYDYHGRRRAILGPSPPPAGHALGDEWDPSPGLDFFYQDGEKAASLSVDSHDFKGGVALALFRDHGRSVVGLANAVSSQGVWVGK